MRPDSCSGEAVAVLGAIFWALTFSALISKATGVAPALSE